MVRNLLILEHSPTSCNVGTEVTAEVILLAKQLMVYLWTDHILVLHRHVQYNNQLSCFIRGQEWKKGREKGSFFMLELAGLRQDRLLHLSLIHVQN